MASIAKMESRVFRRGRMSRKRFDDELIGLMLRFKWWDRSIDEINAFIPLLTCSDLEKVRRELSARV